MQHAALDQAVATGKLVELTALLWQRRFGFHSGHIAYVIGYVAPAPRSDARSVYQAFWFPPRRARLNLNSKSSAEPGPRGTLDACFLCSPKTALSAQLQHQLLDFHRRWGGYLQIAEGGIQWSTTSNALDWEQRLGDLARLAQALVHEFGEAPAAAPPLQQLPGQPPGIERAAGLPLGAQRILSGVLLGLGLLLWLPAFFLPAARLGLLAAGGIFVAIGLLHAVHSLLRRH